MGWKMDNNEWFECGARIGDLVQSAVDSMNFNQLNKSITDALNDSIDAVQESVFGRGAQKKTNAPPPGRTGYGEYRAAGTAWEHGKSRANTGDLFDTLRSSGGSSSRSAAGGMQTGLKGLASMITGYTLAGIFGMGTLALFILWMVVDLPFVFTAISGILTAGFGFMGFKGLSLRKKQKQAARYLEIMGTRDTCTIEELAAGSGRSVKAVTKDLKEMIEKGLFGRPAYMDDEQTVLMTSHAAYRQYRETMNEAKRAARSKEEQELARREAERNMASLSEETQVILREGKDFIEHIHQCNDKIPDETMTRKLDVLEQVVTRIFEQVAAKPESAPDLHRMMSYYLPITRKLVDAYIELGNQNINSGNVAKTRQEIEVSLDTINAAFEAFLDEFFRDTAWDISSDISTLKTMMARDGLTGQPEFAGGERIKTVGKDVTGGYQTASAGGAASASLAGGAAAAAPAPQNESIPQ